MADARSDVFKDVNCLACNGSGRDRKKRKRKCPECSGSGKALLCRSCGERMPCSGTDFDIMDQGRCLNVPWMYCPGCGDRYQGVGPGVCSICRTRMRVWKDPHRRPPPADVTKIDKRGTGM